MMSTCPDSAETSCFVEKNELDEKRKTKKEELLMVEMMKSCRWSWDVGFDEFDVEREMISDGVFVEKNGCWWTWCRKDEKLSCAACAMKWSEVKVKRKRMCKMCSLKCEKVDWRWELLFAVSKKVRKRENNLLFWFWQKCAKKMRLDEWHAKKSRVMKVRKSKLIDRWLKWLWMMWEAMKTWWRWVKDKPWWDVKDLWEDVLMLMKDDEVLWCWSKMMKTCDESGRWLTDEEEVEEEDTRCPRCARDVCWRSDSMRRGKSRVEMLLCAW
jgi:hypothetical protein